MVKTAEERITQSRVRLLLTKPFFGQLAVRLKIEDASSYIPTAATDGRRFMFNRDFVNSLPDEMLDFLVGHEVLHCVFDHMQARGDRKPMLYNAAADYNINMTLVEQNIGKPITEDKLEGGKICLDWKYSGWNSYEIYDDLLKNQQDAKGMDVHMDEIAMKMAKAKARTLKCLKKKRKCLQMRLSKQQYKRHRLQVKVFQMQSNV